MFALTLAAWLAQAAPCTASATALRGEGARRASAFDLAAAAEAYAEAVVLGCEDADLAATYVRALQAARDAYGAGGSAQALEPVRRAEAALERLAAQGRPVAEIARVVLMAAAAAAQSERDEMETLLAHATYLERLRLLAGDAGVPGVSAHEAAGDLWLQVHRFAAAREAFREAERQIGMTPRIALGLARVAVRLRDGPDACEAYATLVRAWGTSPGTPEILEARTYLAERSCR
jgi:hypothetical protein